MHETATFRYEPILDMDFEKRPKQNFMTLSANPYNGNVFLTLRGPYTSFEIATAVIRDVSEKMEQLSELLGKQADLTDFFMLCDGQIDFEQFASCPFCGCQPIYDDERHEIVCCGGHARFYDFSDREDAIRFWNMRAKKVA